MPGELRIPNLVAPCAKVAGLLDPPQKVSVAQASAVEEHRLIDGAGSVAHRCEGGAPPLGEALAKWQRLV